MMSVRSNGMNLVAGEAMALYRVVKLSTTAGECLMADAADYLEAIGVVEEVPAEMTAAGVIPAATQVTVTPLAGGVRKVSAAGTIAAGGLFEITADGEIVAVGTTSTEPCMGRVIGAVTDGAVAECVFFGMAQVRNLS
jgi:hypothetical protein